MNPAVAARWTLPVTFGSQHILAAIARQAGKFDRERK